MNWFNRLKLAHKLLITFLACAALTAAVGVLGFLRASDLGRTLEGTYENGVVPLQLVGEAGANLQAHARNYVRLPGLKDAVTQKDANGQNYLQPYTDAQLKDAVNAAYTVGDDHIQEQSGFVNPESFTHGTSEQREYWFANGYKNGLGVCDTFKVAGDKL